MSSKTKIVVLRMKEVIYTAIFVGLAILLLILCFIMFRPEKKAVPSASTYIPRANTVPASLLEMNM